jgi:small subunit ribosomal protein S7
MPRRREVPKRETLPDPVFGSTLITKFVNCMMIQGKKSVAEGAFYGGLEIVKDRAKEDPVKIFKKAMDNVKPILEVKSRRVGGATYQVPIEVPKSWPPRSWMLRIIEAEQLRKKKIRIAWPKPTRLLLIIVGS